MGGCGTWSLPLVRCHPCGRETLRWWQGLPCTHRRCASNTDTYLLLRPSWCGGGAFASASGPTNCAGYGGGGSRRACASLQRGGESSRRRRPDEDPASWSLAVFFIHFGSFIIVAISRRSGNGGGRESGGEEAGTTAV
jgi:hypothetical protein